MMIALLGMTGAELPLLAWQIALDRVGAPYVVLALNEEPDRRLLIEAMDGARFQALILAGGEVIDEALNRAQRAKLEALERRLGLRRLVAYTYPGAMHGLRPPVWAGPLDGVSATLTTGGRQVFPYLQASLPIDPGSWGYLAQPLAPSRFETLLAATGESVLLGIHVHEDGREQMIQTFAANSEQDHAQLLRRGQLAWVTRGTHLGLERNYLPLHVDDVLLANHSWNVAAHTTDTSPGATIRMTAEDASRAARWSRSRDLRLDLVCCASGSERHVASTGDPTDSLLAALVSDRDAFGWINHTYEHRNLDRVPRALIETEIEQNVISARRAGIELEPTSLVTGAHSGLANLAATPPRGGNPELGDALHAQGVEFIACDASRPYPVGAAEPAGEHLAPGTPFAVGSSLAIPRHPMALAFDAATREQAVDRWRTTSPGGTPATWQALLATEARRIFSTVLSNDPRPHYFHQSNLVCDGAGEGLIYDLIDAVLDRYGQTVTGMPIVQPTFREIGVLLLRSMAWRAALAAGSVSVYTDRRSVTIENRSPNVLDVPLTGTVAGARYGATCSGWVRAGSGRTVVGVGSTERVQTARRTADRLKLSSP